MRSGPLARGTCRLFAAVGLIIAIACSDSRDRRAPADDMVGSNNRGVGLMGQFNYDAARDIFVGLAAAHPDRLDLQVNLAIATLNRQREGDAEEARRILERVSAADPRNLRARYSLGLLLLNDGRTADALPQFAFVAEHAPADAFAAYYAARCRFEQNDFTGALAGYERAQALDPHLRSAAYGASQAMQRLGRTAEAEQLLNVFQELGTDPRSEVVEFKYTRMGRLAEAVTIDQPPPQPAPRPTGPIFDPTPVALGPAGVTWRRFDASHPASITAADIDGDGEIDIFIAGAIDDRGATRNAVLFNRGPAGFVLDTAHPLAAVPGVTAALWGDYDNDGLTDVYLCRDGANQLWRQTAKGHWANVTAAAHADGGGGATIDGALFDADHDGDLDLLLIKRDGGDELLNNNGDGTFRSIATKIGLTDARPSTGLVVADLDADRDADIILIKKDGAAPGTPQRSHLAVSPGPGLRDVCGSVDRRGRRRRSRRRWSRRDLCERYRRHRAVDARPRPARGTSALVAGTASLAGSVQLALADIDGDGRLDLIGTGADGRVQAVTISPGAGAAPLLAAQRDPVAGWTLAMLDATRGPSLVAMPADTGGAPMMWRPGAGRFPFVTIALSGRDPRGAQLRSNVSGIGTQIAARAGSQWTALATYRSQSGVGQSLQPLSIGTGGRPQIDFVAMTWSDGVFQSELALVAGPPCDRGNRAAALELSGPVRVRRTALRVRHRPARRRRHRHADEPRRVRPAAPARERAAAGRTAREPRMAATS